MCARVARATPTDDAAGNPPSAPSIAWHKLSEMWSATSAEHAFVDGYELIAFDIPEGFTPAGVTTPRVIAWEIYTGLTFATGIAGGQADSFAAAKMAAEQELQRLEVGHV